MKAVIREALHYVRLSRLVALTCIFMLAAMIWKYTPLQEYVTLEWLKVFSRTVAETPAPVLTVIAAFVAASFLLFPVMAMVVLCGLALPPLQAVVAGVAGVALSSITGYTIGRLLGPKRVEALIGPLFGKVRRKLQDNVILSVFIVRHLPLGPFTLVNTVLGSMHLNFWTFVFANGISLLPSILASAMVGGQLQ